MFFFLHHEMCISPLILGFVGEYYLNINECEFSISGREQMIALLCAACVRVTAAFMGEE